ncbi:MAG TPA: Rrf2 family transcriptional regulator [Prosthecochloris aestuarii]|uniref:Rrf2 family transcriptional regulator n=1 Tax=Prosthecochloris aestuarii TaxID=1102 RepID=A0A831ST62_PROAE|nr:Rrf2 family transcriptional regulator [Prosthecochloris aestuarii]
MQVLTKHNDYAIRALLELAARPGEYLSARRIADAQQIPYQFLRGILQELVRGGLVGSKEGARGGVKLQRKPEDISLREVIELFQGKVELSECMFRKQLCANRSKCVLRHQIMKIEQVVSREFDRITIGSLLDDLKMLNSADTTG